MNDANYDQTTYDDLERLFRELSGLRRQVNCLWLATVQNMPARATADEMARVGSALGELMENVRTVMLSPNRRVNAKETGEST